MVFYTDQHGKHIHLTVSVDITGRDLKRQIEIVEGIPPELIRLRYNRNAVGDNNILSSLGMTENSQFEMSVAVMTSVAPLSRYTRSRNTVNGQIIPFQNGHAFVWVFSDKVSIQRNSLDDIVEMFSPDRTRVSGNTTYDTLSRTLTFTPYGLRHSTQYQVFLKSCFFKFGTTQLVSDLGVSVRTMCLHINRLFVCRERIVSFHGSTFQELTNAVGSEHIHLSVPWSNSRLFVTVTASNFDMLKEDDVLYINL